MKISLDKDSLQQYAQDHVEKLVFGVIFLVFCYLIYSSMGRERYETADSRTPSVLEEKASGARAFISNAHKPDTVETGLPKSDFETMADAMIVKIRPNFYSVGNWDGPPIEDLPPRPQPRLLAVTSLTATSGRDAFNVKVTAAPTDTATGVGGRAQTSAVEGRRWAMVTGVIPFEDQASVYQKTFANVKFKDPAKDTAPEYYRYIVQRAVINNPSEAADPTKLKWENPPYVPSRYPQATSAHCAYYAQQVFSEMRSEEVDPEYIIESMVMPLAPRIRTEQNPLLEGMGGMGGMGVMGGTTQAEGGVWGRLATAKDIPLIIDKQPEDQTTGPDGPTFDDPTRVPDPRQPERTPQIVEDEKPPVRLLRFFDFTLEPGKYYVYRFQLQILNPNFEIPAEYLADPTMETTQYILSPWSEPTKPVTVEPDSRMLVGSTTSPVRVTDEPKVTMKVAKWFISSGREESTEIPSLRRGALINKELDGTGLIFDTDGMVIDIRGGDSLTRRLKEPGRVLVFDRDGKLVVRNELNDAAEYSMLGVEMEDPAVPGGEGVLGLPGTEDSGEPGLGLPPRGRGPGGLEDLME